MRWSLKADIGARAVLTVHYMSIVTVVLSGEPRGEPPMLQNPAEPFVSVTLKGNDKTGGVAEPLSVATPPQVLEHVVRFITVDVAYTAVGLPQQQKCHSRDTDHTPKLHNIV
jgi:hypothetical protein